MANPRQPSQAIAQIPFAIDALVTHLPELAPPARYTRQIGAVYWSGIGAWVLGGVLVVYAKRSTGAAANLLGSSGLGFLYLGAALIALLALLGIGWAVVGLFRARKMVLNRLEATYLEEQRIVELLRAHPRDDLTSRARYARLQAQLFDRIALLAGLIATGCTAAAPLMKAWGDSRVWKTAFEFYQYFPAALVMGICLAALINLGQARNLMRAANLYEEAAAEPEAPGTRARRAQSNAPDKPQTKRTT